jgi:hypothetical protein
MGRRAHGPNHCEGAGCDETSRRSGDDNSTPRGGIDTGYGGMAREGEQAEDSTAFALILGGALSALLGAGLVTRAGRRRT